jgi:polar amino acid transport system substrate-binding protein
MTIQRRSIIAGLAAAGLAMPLVARAEGTLDEAKKRGSLRVGVTQAPPWYS